MANLRNIGISAHIDSGKTTLTERILFYTGRIKQIHEVRGKDGVGAKMDSMELEREKGITIKSAATYTRWNETEINIIDTPGHVDFTIEVERSMRVLDGAILVICGASAVQSQSITVNRQMDRYNVPRIAFINKLDRQGANAIRAVDAIKKKLKLNAELVQLPIGSEQKFEGVIDLIGMKMERFEGKDGSDVISTEIPNDLIENARWHRSKLIEAVANVDSKLEDKFLLEEEPSVEEIRDGIRRATIALKFVPVFVGSAAKNKGVQPLLDGVEYYLPAPNEVQNHALETVPNDKKPKSAEKKSSKGNRSPPEKETSDLAEGKRIEINIDATKPLLCLAFKLEESKYGQLTWVRVYQGVLKKGDYIYNISKGNKRVKVNRLVKMHSEEIVDIDNVKAGEIAALFGVDCDSGTTFGSSGQTLLLTSMKVPEPVISLAVQLKDTRKSEKFSRALKRFQREDPTFKVSIEEESKELVLSGMGELHLDIYLERLRREYDADTKVSPPRVNFRERITRNVPFEYQYKKQTGGQGMYAKIIGHIEPIAEDDPDYPLKFVSLMKGLTIPPEFIASTRKAFFEKMKKGPLLNAPLQGVRFVLEDGVTHEVDSSDLAFAMATRGALREALPKAGTVLYEPIMEAEIQAPLSFQSAVVAGLSRRNAVIRDLQRMDEVLVIKANVPLVEMFGYAGDLRGCTEGKGEFSMEYLRHDQTAQTKQNRLVKTHQKSQGKQAEKMNK